MRTLSDYIVRYASVLAAVGCAAAAGADTPRLPRAEPQAVGLHAGRLAWIEPLVADAIAARRLPGCVVLIGRRGHVAYLRSFGDREIEPARAPMNVDTVFDLASLTKPVATATCVMLLAEQGKLGLHDVVARHLPEFGSHGKDQITIEQLLTHTGGLLADNPVEDYADGPRGAWQRICDLAPQQPPGTKFVYSDVGYVVLGELVERVSGQKIDALAEQRIFQPLGMLDTGYLPSARLRARAAPTEKRDGQWIRGDVHDPRAFRLGGVAGHAGLFGTAEDLALYAQMLLAGGTLAGERVLAPESVRRMTAPRETAGTVRGLGWDMRSAYSINRGELYGPRAFGHGGFTGTVLWIDPDHEMFLIFLSNRLHPDGRGEVNRLAGPIGTIAAAAIEPALDPPSPPPGKGPAAPAFENGLDVLARDRCSALAGRNVGLIVNHTSRTASGVEAATLLARAPGVRLVALFSPEHGYQGRLDTATIADDRDPATGLPVYSLYGKSRRPSAESLRGIDTLVFDIQDIGTRFYTYISTLGLAMQAAAERRIRFVVLDRVNPIGGAQVEGPVLDAGQESFVGFHRLPVRHGMTVGELARMFNDELRLGLDLEVIPVKGWQRDVEFDATGLPWIHPSPNMRSPTAALLYPGVGLLETTNVSVGRGTETPFEVVGAPWIEGPRLAETLAAANLPGIRFFPTRFTPTGSTHDGQACQGVCLIVLDRQAVRPVRVGLEIAAALRRMYPQAWQAENYGKLLGNRAAFEALLAGRSAADIEAGWQVELSAFLERRTRYVIYDATAPVSK